MPDGRYFTELAAAFVRGKLGDAVDGSDDNAIAEGLAAGLRLHKFKRNTELPRVRAVLGALHGIAPSSILDLGSGRGTFLWPLLDSFPTVTVVAADIDERRATDIGAVRRGGIERLSSVRMDAMAMAMASESVDVVTLLEVAEHLAVPGRAFAEAVRVARRFVIVSVPSKEDDNPEHIHVFDQLSLERALTDAGAARVRFSSVLNHRIAIAAL